MSLRNQPYIPLYVQDFMTDEKLNECSAAANGVYIRLMCLMHKSEEYGTILLKQKDKQNESNIQNFACKLVKNMPFTVEEIFNGLKELVEENVVHIEGDKLIQKRMIKDNYISEIRSNAGSKGGNKRKKETQNEDFASDFAQAKNEAKQQAKTKQNTENEYENEIENETEIKKIDPYCSFERKSFDEICEEVFGQKPILTNEDCLNFSDLASTHKDFFTTLKENLIKTSKLNFEKIGYKPDAGWFLKPKNYAALRNGVYDDQIKESEYINDGFSY